MSSYKKVQVHIRLPRGILAMLDEAAQKDLTSRSDIIRMAILWYLRPQGRDLERFDPEEILKVLQHRQSRAAMREIIKNATDWYDG